MKAVVAQSFERIHRSNLCGMGVLPLQFPEGVNAQTLKLDGTETFDILGLSDDIKPMSDVTLVIHRADGTDGESSPLKSRIDTAIEVDYVRHGGILPFVLRQLLGSVTAPVGQTKRGALKNAARLRHSIAISVTLASPPFHSAVLVAKGAEIS